VEILGWVLISAIPVAGLLVLGILMNRWGKKHDPMGGTTRNILPLDGEARRPSVYHD
jgi:hypothetical protein